MFFRESSRDNIDDTYLIVVYEYQAFIYRPYGTPELCLGLMVPAKNLSLRDSRGVFSTASAMPRKHLACAGEGPGPRRKKKAKILLDRISQSGQSVQCNKVAFFIECNVR